MEQPKTITFVTENPGKVDETQEILGNDFNLKWLQLDLPELQGELDEICVKKCKEALKYVNGPVLVEDSALCFNSLNGLPGIKY